MITCEENPPSVTQLAEMGKKKPEPRKKQKPRKGRKQKPKQRPLVGGGPIIQQCVNGVKAIVREALGELQGDEVDCLFAALADALNEIATTAAAARDDASHDNGRRAMMFATTLPRRGKESIALDLKMTPSEASSLFLPVANQFPPHVRVFVMLCPGG